jgi:hypothetical protein
VTCGLRARSFRGHRVNVDATIGGVNVLAALALSAAFLAPTAPAPPLSPSTCQPVSNGGNCYRPGEFCRNRDHGVTGATADGQNIVCTNNDGWRWEPAS